MEKDIKINQKKGIALKIKQILFGSRKRIIITLIVFVAIVFFAWRTFGQTKAKPQYQTATVTTGNIISTVSESGNVTGSQTTITSPTDGIIKEVYVKNGDHISSGDKLFKVKSTATPQEIASAYASYQSAVSSLQTSETNKTTSQAKLEQDRQAIIDASVKVTTMQNNIRDNVANPTTKVSYTQNDIDSVNSALTSTRETFSADETKYNQIGTPISAAQAQVNSAWLSYQATQDSVVTAPIDGTVANLSAIVGTNVAAGSGGTNSNSSSNNSSGGSSNGSSSTSSSSSNATAVLIIGDFSNIQVKVQASEVDIPKLHAGQKATITLDAFPSKTFAGSISSVDSVGTNSSGVVTYNGYISFAYPPDGIQPGMTASVNIQTDRKDNVLTVPSSAIQTSNSQSTVRVLKNGQITSVPVETGIASDTDTEITSGLSEGDTVVTSIVTTTPSSSSTGTSPFSGIGGNRGFGGGGGGGGGAVRSRGGGG